MAQISWTEFTKLNLNKQYLSQIRHPILELKKLLKNVYETDVLVFRKTYKRIKRRLRNAFVCQFFRKLERDLIRLEGLDVVGACNEVTEFLEIERFDKKTGKIKLPDAAQGAIYLKLALKVADLMSCVINDTTEAFGHCQPWLRLGHLTEHFIVMTSCAARIHFMMKAALLNLSKQYNGLLDLCRKLSSVSHKDYLIQEFPANIPVVSSILDRKSKRDKKDKKLKFTNSQEIEEPVPMSTSDELEGELNKSKTSANARTPKLSERDKKEPSSLVWFDNPLDHGVKIDRSLFKDDIPSQASSCELTFIPISDEVQEEQNEISMSEVTSKTIPSSSKDKDTSTLKWFDDPLDHGVAIDRSLIKDASTSDARLSQADPASQEKKRKRKKNRKRPMKDDS